MLAENNTVAVMKVGNYRINIHAISFIEVFPIDSIENQSEYGVQIHFSAEQYAKVVTLKGQEAIRFIDLYDHMEVI